MIERIKAYFQSKLVDNWQGVLKRSFTTWFAIASALFGAFEFMQDDILALLDVARPLLKDGAAGAVSVFLAAVIPLVRIWRQVKLAIETEMVKERGTEP